jgi:large subunit ribosomal protein L25
MDVTITATVGRTTGSAPSNRLRNDGQIPGVLYGLGRDNITLAVDHRSLRQALTTDAGLNAIITMTVDGTDELCIVRDLQRDPVRHEVTHVDFVRVDPDADILVDVPITLEGEAKKVHDEQGIVDQIAYTLAVFAKPNAIPNELVLNIEDLAVGDTLLVSDIPLPAGSRTEVDPDEVVLTASVTRAAIEETAEEGAEAEGGDEAAEGAEADGDSESSDDDS